MGFISKYIYLSPFTIFSGREICIYETDYLSYLGMINHNGCEKLHTSYYTELFLLKGM
jgi:hypothetical protein